jgi:cyanophycin synthetase
VQAVVIENGAQTILRDGLAYDRCQIGIVTDFDGIEALAAYDVHTPEHMRKALRTQVDVVLAHGCAVLNAGDPHVAELGPLCDGEVIFYAADPAAPALVAHCAAGGRGVTLRNGRIALVANSQDVPLYGLAPLDQWRARHGNLPDEALLAAVAAGWALGVHPRLIGAGLEAFECEAGVPLVASTTAAVAETAHA